MNALLLLSLPAAAAAVQSFRGTDAAYQVTCPLNDYIASPCAPSLAVPPEECSNLQACASEYTPPSDYSFVVIPMTCSCLQLTNCPDTCTSDGTGEELMAPSETPLVETGLDFVGPGTVTCDMNDFFLSPCLPLKGNDCAADDAVAAEYRSSCNTYFVPPTDTNAATVDISLPCGCVTMRNCPMSCTFAASGEAVVVVEDPEDGAGTTTTIDDTTTEEEPADSTSVAVVPTAAPTKETGLINFRGPGLVICPITAYKENPCCKFGSIVYHETSQMNICIAPTNFHRFSSSFSVPSFVVEDNRIDCDSNSCSVEPTDRSDFSQARLPLACSCIELKQCDASCYMEFPTVDLWSSAANLASSFVPATTAVALVVWMIM